MNKILKLIKKLWAEFFALGRYYSWRYASYNFVWWLCFYVRPRFAWNVSRWALNKKTAWLDSYFKEDINAIEDNPTHQKPLTKEEYKIWVFWGQGENVMPPLVKSCYQQLTKHNANVCLVSNYNLRDYIDLPEIIYQKVNNGNLSWAHFSDIVRTSLLAKYGGLWLDATVWVSGKLPIDGFLEMPFWSANGKSEHKPTDICFWTSGEWSWSSWCMSANQTNHYLFCFVSKMMIKTVYNRKKWPDYVFQDYLIYSVCRHSHDFQDNLALMKITNPQRNGLASLMNIKYEATRYMELLSTDCVFKLSYRAQWKSEIDGNLTFYGKLITGEL